MNTCIWCIWCIGIHNIYYIYVITYICFVYMFEQYTLEHFAKDTLNLSQYTLVW